VQGQDAAKRVGRLGTNLGDPGSRPERNPGGRDRNILPELAILPEGPAGGRLDRGRAGNLLEAGLAISQLEHLAQLPFPEIVIADCRPTAP